MKKHTQPLHDWLWLLETKPYLCEVRHLAEGLEEDNPREELLGKNVL